MQDEQKSPHAAVDNNPASEARPPDPALSAIAGRQSDIVDSPALQVVEILLFVSDEPLALPRLCELAGLESTAAQAAVDELNRQYEATERTFRIHKVARGFQLYTLPRFAETVKRLYRRQFVQRLSGPALEVLAIIAYRQPVTKPEIEKLRGVDCSGPVVTLLERRLITTAGRAHKPGNPFLYRTTREFLRYFGLESLDALPPIEELGAFLAGQMEEPECTEAESLAIDYDNSSQPATEEPDETADSADSMDERTKSEGRSNRENTKDKTGHPI